MEKKKGKKKAKGRESGKMTFGGLIANSRKILCVKFTIEHHVWIGFKILFSVRRVMNVFFGGVH